MSGERVVRVAAEREGERLDRFLAAELSDLSRSAIARCIREGHVRVDGRACAPSTKLRAGVTVSFSLPEPRASALVPEDIPLAILHEDDELVVVDKPAGLVVHPGAGRTTGTLVNALLHHVGSRLRGIGGERRPGIVHRIDKGTSGVLVVAKTGRAHEHLSRQFRRREIVKRYLALTLGDPGAEGAVDRPIGRAATARTRMSTHPGATRPRTALTTWVRRETFEGHVALVEVGLHTGRTHQVRVHLASIGCPLVGDPTYGGRRAAAVREPAVRALVRVFPRPALHAWRIGFRHPATGHDVSFEAPVPADLEGLLAALRSRVGPGAQDAS